MSINSKKIFLLLLCSLMSHCFISTPQNIPEYSKNIVKVGDQIIKEDHLRLFLNLELHKFPVEFQNQATKEPVFNITNLRPVLLRVLNQIIEDEVILQYGKQKKLLLPENELKTAFQKKKREWTQRELNLFLKERKINYHQWKRLIEQEIQTNHIIYVALIPALQVSAKEIKTYYYKNRRSFDKPEEIRVRQIVTDSKDKAKELHKRILNGENFAKLALDHSQSPDRSQGGDLGYFTKGTFPEVFDICFKLKKGALSDIQKSDYGFHIFKVLDRKPKRRQPLREVSNQIYQKLFAEKQETLYKKWLEKIKKDFEITIYENNLKTMTL